MEQYVLFDLDGTLTDSAEGIVNSVIYALKQNGIEETDREKLLAFVGPPLVDSFMKYYGMTEEDAKKTTEDYRVYFRDRGWCENYVYDGIPEALEALRKEGFRLVVATSKPEVFARRIMEYFKLDSYFEIIGGSTLDGRISKKGQVIDYVLNTIGTEERKRVIMVGDREHDVNGARENGLPCVGVLYGYGSREELEAAGASFICPDVNSLPAVIKEAFHCSGKE